MWGRLLSKARSRANLIASEGRFTFEMKRSIRQFCLVALAGAVLASCASRETEIHTSASAGVRAEGSSVTDATDVNGGPGASAAAAAPMGHPGR